MLGIANVMQRQPLLLNQQECSANKEASNKQSQGFEDLRDPLVEGRWVSSENFFEITYLAPCFLCNKQFVRTHRETVCPNCDSEIIDVDDTNVVNTNRELLT